MIPLYVAGSVGKQATNHGSNRCGGVGEGEGWGGGGDHDCGCADVVWTMLGSVTKSLIWFGSPIFDSFQDKGIALTVSLYCIMIIFITQGI